MKFQFLAKLLPTPQYKRVCRKSANATKFPTDKHKPINFTIETISINKIDETQAAITCSNFNYRVEID